MNGLITTLAKHKATKRKVYKITRVFQIKANVPSTKRSKCESTSTPCIDVRTFQSPGHAQDNFYRSRMVHLGVKVRRLISCLGWALKNGLAKNALSSFAKSAFGSTPHTYMEIAAQVRVTDMISEF